MGAFVCMLRCADDSFYVGSATGDELCKRIAQHETGAFPAIHIADVRFGWSAPNISSGSLTQ